jgi:hypothetical protein
MGIPGFLLGGVFAYGGGKYANHIKAKNEAKTLHNIIKSTGIEDEALIKRFLGNFNNANERDEFVSYLRKNGVFGEGINPDSALNNAQKAINEIMLGKKDKLHMMVQNRMSAMGADDLAGLKYPRGNSDVVKRMYKSKMGFWNDDVEKTINDVWQTIEPDAWDNISKPIDRAREFVKAKIPKGQRGLFDENPHMKYKDFVETMDSFEISPEKFMDADRKLNKTHEYIFELPWIKRDADVIAKSNMVHQIKKAGDNVLGDFSKTVKGIFPDYPDDELASNFFKSYGNAYNEYDGLLNKLINMKNMIKEGEINKVVKDIPSFEKTISKVASPGNIAGLIGGSVVPGPWPVKIAAGLALSQLPKIGTKAAKAIKKNPDILKNPYIPLNIMKTLGAKPNLTDDDMEKLKEYMEAPEEEKDFDYEGEMKRLEKEQGW